MTAIFGYLSGWVVFTAIVYWSCRREFKNLFKWWEYGIMSLTLGVMSWIGVVIWLYYKLYREIEDEKND